MATLKDDNSNWKAGSLIRRDFRHVKDEPDIPKHRRKRKNRKKWCKGREGIPHVPGGWVPDPHWNYETIQVKICENCGKRTDYRYRKWGVANGWSKE
jgi:hypothetical protein